MNPNAPLRAALGFGLAAFAIAPLAGQRGNDDFYRAYYLQHEKGDVEGALAVYRRVADNSQAPEELRAKARHMAVAAAEELACSDFARLMPKETIFYVEFNRPGAQLQTLLGHLGLLGGDGHGLGISPLLIEGMLGCRGVAVAIDAIDPRRGPTGGVAVLHPGSLDVVRGLLETALPVAAQPVEAIDGHATFNIHNQAFVTLTSKLAIASEDRGKIAAVLRRMQEGGESSLASSENLAETMKMRGDDLMFFCVNLEPVMPMVMQMIDEATRREPQARAALAFLDVRSTRTIAGRAGVDKAGLSFDLALQLADDHRNLAFNLLRMPALRADTLATVPAGAAFFAAATVNDPAKLSTGTRDDEGRPVVTLMDFGRELFANLVDVSVYAMPTVQKGQWGPIPDIVLAARVNDAERSQALWNFVLGTAQAATGGQPAAPASKGDLAFQSFAIQGVPLFLATHGNDVFLSPSQGAIEASLQARNSGQTVLKDDAFAGAITDLGDHSTRVAALNIGRCCEIATNFMSQREREEMAPFAQMLRDTTARLTLAQGADRMAVAGRIRGLPNMAPVVQQLIEQHTGRRGVGRNGVGAANVEPETPRSVVR